MNKKIRQNLFPVLAALIWGTAFVAQSVSAGHIPPLTFGAIRCSMAFAALALGLWIVRMVQKKEEPRKGGAAGKLPEGPGAGRNLLRCGPGYGFLPAAVRHFRGDQRRQGGLYYGAVYCAGSHFGTVPV